MYSEIVTLQPKNDNDDGTEFIIYYVSFIGTVYRCQ